jgi:rhamnosyltransferase
MHKIAVLMATYNGLNCLPEQVSSILNQVDVDLTLYVSDDGSSDGTYELICELSKNDSRVIVLPRVQRMGAAGKNFYRLICDVDVNGVDYVAFADQDDVWNLNKLSSHIGLIKRAQADAVSSNVLAFWSDGSQKLINKSQPQKSYDFLFESAGPGCTFLMTPWLIDEVRRQLLSHEKAKDVSLHDWLTYAICRAHGRDWVIDEVPSMQYRQHQTNVVGANSGLKAAFTRLKKINSGWYRHEVALISRVVASINPDKKLSDFQKIIQGDSILDQLKLVPYALQGRRKFSDRLVLVISIFLFVF